MTDDSVFRFVRELHTSEVANSFKSGLSMRRVVASLAAFLVVLVVAAPKASAASDASEQRDAGPPSVTKVDAVGPMVELVVAGAPVNVAEGDVVIETGEEPLPVDGITRTQAIDRPTELVIIVDTNARSAQGQVLERVKRQLVAEVVDLAPSTAVAVISAGDTALVETKLTTDRARVVGAIEDLSAKNGSALFNAVDRAGSLLSTEPGVVRSVLLLSTGPDTASDITIEKAQVAMVQRGSQLVSVRYDGGEAQLTRSVARTRGFELLVETGDGLEGAVAEAMTIASDRLLVSFTGLADTGTRSNVRLTIGDSIADFSYPAGARTDNPLQLEPLPVPEPSGLGFFRTSAGLYIALGLAFVGIALGVWSLGSIILGSDTNLDRRLARYTDGSLTVEDDDEEKELIVQSALLRRAVAFSESFAEKQGFLARVEELLERANLPVRAGEAIFILASIIVLSAGLGVALTRSILAALLLGLGAVAIAFFVVRFLGRRRFKTFESQLPDMLQLLSGTLRAGYSLPQGFGVVSKEIADPMGQELRRAMTEARLGRELEESLTGVSERMSSADFAWAVMAIGIQREVGGNLNELLMNVADTMIARERLKRDIGALTAEGRISAAVLSFLPPGLGFVMWIMNPDYVAVLFTEFLGNVFLGLGLVSAMVGLVWMKKVITVDV